MSIIPIVIIKNLIAKIYHMEFLKEITTFKTSLLIFKVCHHYLRNMVRVSHLNTNYSMIYSRLKICM